MLAVVLPYLPVSGSEIKSEARKTATLLRYVNETAALKKQTIPVVFDLDRRTISWAEESAGGLERELRRDRKLRSLYAVELQTKGEVREGELTVLFGPLGLAEFLSVRFRDDDREMTVSFNPVSGRAKIE